MKRITALVLALLMVLALCACGASKEDEAMLGTYTLYAMDYDEKSIVLADGLFDGESYITLKRGGAAEMCMEGDVANIKWKADGTKLTFTAADGDMDGSLSDGLLTLEADGSNLYYVGSEAAKDRIKALTLDELLSGVVSDIVNDTPKNDAPQPAETEKPKDEPKPDPAPTEKPPAQTEPTEVQQLWNGWYYGCIDTDDCTGKWESFNGETFDVTMYIELGADGKGRFVIFDPYGALIQNEQNNLIANAWCHADSLYLYGDSGEVFGCDINPKDWVMVHNLMVPEKVNVDSESTNDDGETIEYDFQFKPWGDRWEGDNYTKFIPGFDSYLGAIDAGLVSPFGDTVPGFGIAGYEIAGVNGAGGGTEPADQPASGGNGGGSSAGGSSALLGTSPEKLDINNRGVVYVYYPADQFRYDDTYGKLKNDDTGVGILIDPMLSDKNFDELKASYEKNNSDEKDYSLVETTVNGYKAMILKYSDWLGSTMRVDIDFGGKHGNFYGMSFAVSGDSLEDCDTELVWAIIQSMEVAG